MPVTDFPTAKRIEPIFEIDGKLYRRVSASNGTKDPGAIRAKVTKADGSADVKWFVPAYVPKDEEQPAA